MRTPPWRRGLRFPVLVLLLGCQPPDKQPPAGADPPAPATRPPLGEARTVRIAGYEFDPALGLPELPPELRPDGQQSHYLVQLFAPPDRALRARLQSELHLSLAAYVPNGAYLEALSPEAVAKLQAMPQVRAVVPFAPAFKVSPTIGKVRFRTEERLAKSGVWLSVALHPGADAQAVVDALKQAGGAELELSDERQRGANALVRVVLPSAADIPRIAQLQGVQSIEEVGEQIEDNGATAGTIQSGAAGTTPLWDIGLHGEGQIVSVNDGGPVDINHCMFQDPLNAAAGPTHRKMVELRDSGAPTRHATHVAGIVAGDDFNNPGTGANRGNAWAARLLSVNRSDNDTLTMLNLNRDSGATIHTNSWHDNTGTPTTYNQTAFDVDTFTWNNQDHLVLGSMGNTGEEQGPPGTAKNAIGVQASQRDPNEGNFGDGNNGPTADGRRKPDVSAPGCNTVSAIWNTPCTIAVRNTCATSYATPATAAAAALMRQYYTEGWYPTGTRQAHDAFTPTGALLKATLLNATVDMAGVGGYPNVTEGWGMLRLEDAAFFAGGPRNLRAWDLRNAIGIANGETREYTVQVVNNAEPLKVTLVWTDPPPATATTATPVVNDLDLTVISPGGDAFLGNQFGIGGQSVPGGAPDTVNPAEQVLINTPAVGLWTLRVTGTSVNVGDPFQGYSLVATADMPESPAPTGAQNTLVVRVSFPDADLAGIDPPLASIQNTMNDVATYIDAVSYSSASVVPDYHPTVITLDHDSGQYFPPNANPLIELTEEVFAKLLGADAAVFTRDPLSTNDDVDRVVLVTNDPDFVGDWATTGSWPYEVPGLGRPLSVSIQSFANNTARFSHGLMHQLNLIDLYAHEGVVFAFPHANDWDNMAKPIEGQHPLVWNKQRAGWIDLTAPDVYWIPRPAAGSSYGAGLGDLNPIPISFQEPDDGDRKAIVIGLTEGAATPANESIYYVVEARDSTDTYDVNVPESGVLLYYVNEDVPQGEGPIWLLDAEPGTDSLADAAFQVGDSRVIPGTGIQINVLAGTGGADFNIQVSYAPPATDNDLNIVKGQTIDGHFKSWMSPDIWVDNARNGFDEDGGGAPNPGNTDQPIEGEINRLYFRLHNPGPADAFDVNVNVRMSEPYHTIGDKADFDRFLGQVHLASVPDLTDPIRFVEWTPDTDGEPHSCAWVETLSVFNDVNTFNNAAQENLREVASTTSSPYTEVNYPVTFSNPYDEPALFYFRAEGIPEDWTRSFSPRKALLAPGERVTVSLTVKPPDYAPVCTDHLIEVSSWASRGDTLIEVGAGATQVGLRGGTKITTEVKQGSCGKGELQGRASVAAFDGHPWSMQDALTPEQLRSCRTLTTTGCTTPPRPFEEVIVRFEDPSGNPVYHSVMTDENGCFEDMYVAVEGGTWGVSAEYPGSDCAGPVIGETVPVGVNISSDGDQDNDGRPDRDEHISDADGDGLTGPMDPDSDNDNVPDGLEPDGDFDGDGLVNVIDPDSDGDGILDGQDPTPWGDKGPSPDTCTSLCDCTWISRVAAVALVLLLLITLALWRMARR